MVAILEVRLDAEVTSRKDEGTSGRRDLLKLSSKDFEDANDSKVCLLFEKQNQFNNRKNMLQPGESECRDLRRGLLVSQS
jgi:hypothetical protein